METAYYQRHFHNNDRIPKKGYVFETDRLTLNEQEYLKNVHEKVSVEMLLGMIVLFNT